MNAPRLPTLAELQQLPGELAHSMRTGSDGAQYLLTTSPDVRPIVQYLRSQYDARVVAVFAEDRCASEGVFFNYYVLEVPRNPEYLIVQAPVPLNDPVFPSLSAELPSLNWQEREIQDWFGMRAVGHPNPRRVALHDNWPDVHPLRKGLSLSARCCHLSKENGTSTGRLREKAYCRFRSGRSMPASSSLVISTSRWPASPSSTCSSACSIPTRVRKSSLKTCPSTRPCFWRKAFPAIPVFPTVRLSARPSNERLKLKSPDKRLVTRTILLELERLCNHVADIGAIATDVGFVIANAHAGRLREMLLTLNEQMTGNRLLRGMVCVGGVRRAWRDGQQNLLRSSIDELSPRV